MAPSLSPTLTKTLLLAAALGLGLGLHPLSADAAPRGPQSAQTDRGARGHKAGGKARAIVKATRELDLNADQQATIDKIEAEMRAARGARGAARGERGEQLEGILDGRITEAQVHARIDERAAEKTARAHQDATWTFEVLAVLSADQRQQLGTILEQRRAERGGGAPGGAAGARGRGKRGAR